MLKALDLARAREAAAAFAVLFFARFLSQASETLLQDAFGQLRAKSGSNDGPNEVVLGIEIFFQRHMRAAARDDAALQDKVKVVLLLCREVALEA